MLQAKPQQLKEISEVKLESLNENEAYLCIDDFGTPAFITGKSLKEVKHPEVKYILVPYQQLTDLTKLRDRFFMECTNQDDDIKHGNDTLEINYAPHDLFEWFRPYLKSEIKSVSDKDIEEHFEISESQCQDPYCVAKQQGQIEGAKWGRDLNSPPIIDISDARIKEYFNNYRQRFMLVQDEEVFALDYNTFVACIKSFYKQYGNTNPITSDEELKQKAREFMTSLEFTYTTGQIGLMAEFAKECLIKQHPILT